jgi:hypothetical protein
MKKKSDFEKLLQEKLEGRLSPIEQRRVDLLLTHLALQNSVFDKLIIEADPLVMRIYEAARGRGKINRPWNRPIECKKRANAYFKSQNNLFFIKEEMLQDDSLYKVVRDQEKRDFRVNLHRKIIKYVLGKAYPVRKLRTKIKKLF